MTATTEMRDTPARRFSRRRVVVVLLLVAGVAAAAWWVTHPRAFLGVGSAMMGPVPVSTRAYVGVETEVLVCHLAVQEGVGFAHEQDIESLCESLRAPTGPVQKGDRLVVQVVGDAAGLVAMNGIDLPYSSGVQRGTQAVGLEAAVIVEDR